MPAVAYLESEVVPTGVHSRRAPVSTPPGINGSQMANGFWNLLLTLGGHDHYHGFNMSYGVRRSQSDHDNCVSDSPSLPA